MDEEGNEEVKDSPSARSYQHPRQQRQYHHQQQQAPTAMGSVTVSSSSVSSSSISSTTIEPRLHKKRSWRDVQHVAGDIMTSASPSKKQRSYEEADEAGAASSSSSPQSGCSEFGARTKRRHHDRSSDDTEVSRSDDRGFVNSVTNVELFVRDASDDGLEPPLKRPRTDRCPGPGAVGEDEQGPQHSDRVSENALDEQDMDLSPTDLGLVDALALSEDGDAFLLDAQSSSGLSRRNALIRSLQQFRATADTSLRALTARNPISPRSAVETLVSQLLGSSNDPSDAEHPSTPLVSPCSQTARCQEFSPSLVRNVMALGQFSERDAVRALRIRKELSRLREDQQVAQAFRDPSAAPSSIPPKVDVLELVSRLTTRLQPHMKRRAVELDPDSSSGSWSAKSDERYSKRARADVASVVVEEPSALLTLQPLSSSREDSQFLATEKCLKRMRLSPESESD